MMTASDHSLFLANCITCLGKATHAMAMAKNKVMTLSAALIMAGDCGGTSR